MPTRPVAHALGVFGVFAAGFALLFSPVWLTGGVLGTSDAIVYYHPIFSARPGAWTDLLYAGYPAQADPQNLAWYPPAMLLAPLGAWNAFVVSGYALASSFAYGYGLRITGRPGPAWIAGIAYGASGFAIAHLDHITIVHGLAWIPLVLTALEALRERIDAGWVAAGAVGLAGVALAGHPQVLVYAAVLAAAYALFAAFAAPVGRLRYAASAAAVGALGAGLAAIGWIPALELAAASTRAALTRDAFFLYALEPWQLGQLLMPYLFGGAVLGAVPPAGAPETWPLPYFGPGRFAEVSGAVSTIAVALGCAALWLRRDRLVVFWSVVAAASVALALGESVPVVSDLSFVLPGWNRFRIPGRHLMELSLAVAALAAIGVSVLADRERSVRLRVIAGASALVAAFLMGGAAAAAVAIETGALAVPLHWAKVAAVEAVPWRSAALALQLGVVALAFAALGFWCGRPDPRRSALLAAAVAVELAAAAALGTWRLSPTRDASSTPPVGWEPLRDALEESRSRAIGLSFDAPDTALPVARNLYWRVPSALGYGPLPLSTTAELLGLAPAGLTADAMGRVIRPVDRTLDLLAVRYLAVPDGSERSEAEKRERIGFRPARRGRGNWPQVVAYLDAQPRWERRATLAGAVVYENRRAMPRAWLAPETRVLSRDAIVRSIHAGVLPDGSAFDPARTALVEVPVDPAPRCEAPCGEITWLDDDPTSPRLRVELRAPSLLVLSDADYPGWRAFSNDRELPVHRVFGALRGVALPAGLHELRMELDSTARRGGAALTLASGLVSIAAVGLSRRKRAPAAI